jgi:hypothetical protein
MAYKTRKETTDVKSTWDKNPVDFVTDETAAEIRSIGGSQRYGQGGKWINNVVYQSIGGYRSRGGMPLKLRTKDEIIPISETDATELLNANLIKRTWE